MAINFCMNCGAKLEENALVCSECGHPVPHTVVYDNDGVSSSEATLDEVASDHVAADGIVADGAMTDGAMTDGAEVDEATPAESLDLDEPVGVEQPPKSEYATTTGTQAEANTPEPDEDFSKYADFTGFDVLNTHPTVAPAEMLHAQKADQTGVMEPIKQRSVTEFVAPEKEKKSHLTTPIKIAAAIAAALLVVAGVGLLAQPQTQSAIQNMVPMPGSPAAEETAQQSEAGSSETSSQTEAETSEAAASSSSPTTVRDAKAVLDDDTAFEQLEATYDNLQSYNQRVYACLQTYNGAIFSSDKTQRNMAAGIASSLLSEIEKEMKLLDSMNIGRASPLYDDYENVRNLLNDQYQRLAVVVESWDISLGFDTPYEHQQEILEPLTRDVGPTGENSYLEDFDAKYWDSRPSR